MSLALPATFNSKKKDESFNTKFYQYQLSPLFRTISKIFCKRNFITHNNKLKTDSFYFFCFWKGLSILEWLIFGLIIFSCIHNSTYLITRKEKKLISSYIISGNLGSLSEVPFLIKIFCKYNFFVIIDKIIQKLGTYINLKINRNFLKFSDFSLTTCSNYKLTNNLSDTATKVVIFLLETYFFITEIIYRFILLEIVSPKEFFLKNAYRSLHGTINNFEKTSLQKYQNTFLFEIIRTYMNYYGTEFMFFISIAFFIFLIFKVIWNCFNDRWDSVITGKTDNMNRGIEMFFHQIRELPGSSNLLILFIFEICRYYFPLELIKNINNYVNSDGVDEYLFQLYKNKKSFKNKYYLKDLSKNQIIISEEDNNNPETKKFIKGLRNYFKNSTNLSLDFPCCYKIEEDSKITLYYPTNIQLYSSVISLLKDRFKIIKDIKYDCPDQGKKQIEENFFNQLRKLNEESNQNQDSVELKIECRLLYYSSILFQYVNLFKGIHPEIVERISGNLEDIFNLNEIPPITYYCFFSFNIF